MATPATGAAAAPINPTQASADGKPSGELKPDKTILEKSKPVDLSSQSIAKPPQGVLDNEAAPKRPRGRRKGPALNNEAQQDRSQVPNSVDQSKSAERTEAIVPTVDAQVRAELDRLAARRLIDVEHARHVAAATATRDVTADRTLNIETATARETTLAARRSDTASRVAPAPTKSAQSERASENPLPPEVREAYVQVGDRFYDRQDTSRVVFVDKGRSLRTASNDPETAKAIVSVADARGWTDIKVKGSEVFRREVYIEASARGVRVAGYNPSREDAAEVEARARRFIERNAVLRAEAQEFRELVARDSNTVRPELASVALAARQARQYAKEVDDPALRALLIKDLPEKIARGLEQGDRPKPLTDPSLLARIRVPEGEYIEAKRARYRFDENEQPSFYVKYRDSETGDVRLKWGKDLERALLESQAQPGDLIRLQREGARAVQINANVRDATDRVVGQQRVEAQRNDWKVEVVERRAERIREAPERAPARGR